MQAVTGVFLSQLDAERAIAKLLSSGLRGDRVTLLTPGGNIPEKLKPVPVGAAEGRGIGTAIGAVVGGAAGLSGGLVAAVVPGVGPVSAIGLLGAAVLPAAGASLGGVVGRSLEDSTSEGLPEDEIFVYEDALRKGRTVVVAMVDDAADGMAIRKLLKTEGAESVDAARERWWIGLRSAEREHYVGSGGNFRDDEKFYRLGFEAALHARNRCKEFDRASAEMSSKLGELQQQYPGVNVADPFTRGYERGREYYQHLCGPSKAA
jgi:hypothetical protein